MKFIPVHTSPRAYLPLSEFALIRLETAIAFICTCMAGVGIEGLIALVTPVLPVEKDVGFGDDEEMAGIFLFIMVIIKVQNLRIIQFNAN
ncbi:MAG: hypothetical protein GY696_18715, partial [Gammaproteobacteria bacterium]|nr:hypothetical protein [Gammaproteobacteria bacterium]